MQIKVVKIASISATSIEYHIPSSPNIRGNSRTPSIWYTSVLIKEISAEIGPLLSAVKNDEPKIENPEKINDRAKILSPLVVIS